MESNKGTSVTRFGYGPDDEDITIHFYEGQGRFEVKNKDIAGPMIFATDDLLEPEVPKGARLLVNEKKTKVDENGCYVFRRIDDGTYRYTYANKKPEIRSDLSGLELIGQVWEAQTMVEIADGGTVGDGKLVPPKDPNKKFKVWFPFWTAV